MKERYTYLVVEDVDLQRRHLMGLLSRRPDLQPLGDFNHATPAYEFLSGPAAPTPDLLFLDIEMPEIDGFGLLEACKRRNTRTQVIITTAYPEYAIKGYEYAITGYVLKPIEPDKLNRAIDRAIDEINRSEGDISALTPEGKNDFLLIRDGAKWVRIDYAEIVYCEGANVNVRIVCPDRTYLTRDRLKNIEGRLPTDSFLRIHDSFVINLDHVRGYAKNYSFVEMKTSQGSSTLALNVGPTYLSRFREAVGRLFPAPE